VIQSGRLALHPRRDEGVLAALAISPRSLLSAALVALLLGFAGGGSARADESILWSTFGYSQRRDNGAMMRLVRPLTEAIGESVVQVLSDGRPVALGTIVDDDGLVLTKRSELTGDPLRVRLDDGRLVPARVAAVRRNNDLALLQIDSDSELKAIEFAAHTPAIGSFLITAGRAGRPIGLGVVGVAPRAIDRTARLGVMLTDDSAGGASVQAILPGSGADRAGMKPGDRIVAINGTEQSDDVTVTQTLRGMYPGDVVRLTVIRDGTTVELDARMRELAVMRESESDTIVNGPRNARLSGFDEVVQHDTVLAPDECGGPVLDTLGRVVGLNIARAGRVVSYSLPSSLLEKEISRLRQQLREAERQPEETVAGTGSAVAAP